MLQPVTPRIVYAAAQDAGNRSMRKAGRSTWNAADRRAADAEFARLVPTPEAWMDLVARKAA